MARASRIVREKPSLAAQRTLAVIGVVLARGLLLAGPLGHWALLIRLEFDPPQSDMRGDLVFVGGCPRGFLVAERQPDGFQKGSGSWWHTKYAPRWLPTS
ncbi:hypothetical protein GCM10027444_39570 [Actinopolyspora lacussalsi]